MNDIKIELGPIVSRAQERAKIELEGNVNRMAASVISGLTSSGQYGGKEGLAHEIVRKKVEDYVLSEAFSKKIDQILIDVADEETTRAVRVLLASKTRKALFEATANT